MTAFTVLIAPGAADCAGVRPFAECGEEQLVKLRREHVHGRAATEQCEEKDDCETGIDKKRIDGRFEANGVWKQVSLS